MTSWTHRAALVLFCAIGLPAQSNDDAARHLRLLYDRGQWKEAAEFAPDSRSAEVYFYRGLALARLGQIDRAERVFLDARHLYPVDPRFALELAGVAYREKDNSAAKKYLQEALRLAPGDAYGNDFLATLYLLDGNLAAALKYWNRVDQPVIQSLQMTPPPDLTPVLRERAFAISPGQIFTLNRLWTTQAILDRLDIFAQYQFELKPGQEQRFDLTFRSVGKAQPVSGWLGRVLPLVRGLPYQTLYFDRYNLGRRGINFSSLWRWDAEKRRANVDLSGPFRQNPQWRYRWILDARDENWDLRTTYRGARGGLEGINLQKVETGADLQFGLSGRLQWTTGLRVAARRFRHGDGGAVFANSWSFAQQNGLDYRLWIWPERRVHIDASVNLETGRLFTGSAPVFATIKADLNGSWMPQSKGDNLAVNARIRSGRTFGAVPFDELFMLGMERDNDLWLRGHLGAHDGRKGSAPLGTEYALAQTEVLRTLWQFPFVRLQAGPFFDAGRIADRSGAFGSRGWLYDAGVQVTVATIGAVRWSVIYGRDLRDGRGVFYTSVSR